MTLTGHNDTITGLTLSPDEKYLLSNAMDSSLRCWDVRAFVSSSKNDNRCLYKLNGVVCINAMNITNGG
jgi:Prp8 binding protein